MFLLILLLALAGCGPFGRAQGGPAAPPGPSASTFAASSPQTLTAVLQEPDWRARSRAISALARMGSRAAGAVPALAALAEDQQERPHLRLEAAHALVEIAPQDARTIATLVRILSDEQRALWSDVALLIGRVGTSAQEAAPALIRLAHDRETQVRYSAVSALGGIGPAPGVVEALAEALRDRDPLIQMEAARGLGRLGPAAGAAVPALAEALKDPDPFVARNARQALEKIGQPE